MHLSSQEVSLIPLWYLHAPVADFCEVDLFDAQGGIKKRQDRHLFYYRRFHDIEERNIDI